MEESLGTAENKRLMQEIFAGIASGDPSLFRESLADDVVITVTGQYSWSRTFTGKASLLKDLYGYVRSRLADPQKPGRTIAHRFIADGEYVAVEARGDMVTSEGIRYDNDYCLVYRLAHGKIAEIREYCDSALTEAVLGPYPAPASAS